MDIPDIESRFGDTKTAVRKTRAKVQNSISILPDRRICDKCGAECEAGSAFDPDTGAFHQGPGGYRPAWLCTNDECGAKYRREAPNVTFDPYDR